MTQRNTNGKRMKRMEEEAQLVAKEKLLEETLVQIRKQRKCLLIERLELESLKASLNTLNPEAEAGKEDKASQTVAPEGEGQEGENAGPSGPSISEQEQGRSVKPVQKTVAELIAESSSRQGDGKASKDGTKCETEEKILDLHFGCTGSESSTPTPDDGDDDDDDEEEDDDDLSDDESSDYDSDPDDLIIDIDMLMTENRSTH